MKVLSIDTTLIPSTLVANHTALPRPCKRHHHNFQLHPNKTLFFFPFATLTIPPSSSVTDHPWIASSGGLFFFLSFFFPASSDFFSIVFSLLIRCRIHSQKTKCRPPPTRRLSAAPSRTLLLASTRSTSTSEYVDNRSFNHLSFRSLQYSHRLRWGWHVGGLRGRNRSDKTALFLHLQCHSRQLRPVPLVL